MSGLHKSLILSGGWALVLSIAFGWESKRGFPSARQELVAVTTANEFLKRTLSDMTIAITAKDREIDRLRQSACDGQKARPVVPMRPGRNKASESAAVRAGNNQPIASTESAAK